MYLSYFGLKDRPFRITPDATRLFMTKQYEAAIESFQYAISERLGFMVLTGEVGTGKTTMTRDLMSRLDDTDVATALLLNPLLSVPELLRAINRDFGIPVRVLSPQRQIESLNKKLLEWHGKGRSAVVIVDESQNLSFEALEMIRMLGNLETEHEKLVQVLLVGQPELERQLASHELRQLRQRIAVHAALKPLSYTEMLRYIGHRLTVAGGQGKIYFDSKAYKRIFKITGGVPRLINMLCERCLMAAYAAGSATVTKKLVKSAQADLYGGGLVTEPRWKFWKRRASSVAASTRMGFD